MMYRFTLAWLILSSALFAIVAARPPLEYAPEPANVYVPPKIVNTTSLLDFIKSRDDLSILSRVVEEPAGFTKAFDTIPTWSFTFFAPSDAAFNNTGKYFKTLAGTNKGKWWLGNLLQHHYLPNTALKSSEINGTLVDIQTSNYLYVSAHRNNQGDIILNGAAKVVEADLQVTKGLVYIIDHILDPSAQIYEEDRTKIWQTFIAGSCSNLALSYC